MGDLTHATVDELFAEIQRRTDIAILVYVDVKDVVQMLRYGRKVACMGLAEYARRRLYDWLMEPQNLRPTE